MRSNDYGPNGRADQPHAQGRGGGRGRGSVVTGVLRRDRASASAEHPPKRDFDEAAQAELLHQYHRRRSHLLGGDRGPPGPVRAQQRSADRGGASANSGRLEHAAVKDFLYLAGGEAPFLARKAIRDEAAYYRRVLESLTFPCPHSDIFFATVRRDLGYTELFRDPAARDALTSVPHDASCSAVTMDWLAANVYTPIAWDAATRSFGSRFDYFARREKLLEEWLQVAEPFSSKIQEAKASLRALFAAHPDLVLQNGGGAVDAEGAAQAAALQETVRRLSEERQASPEAAQRRRFLDCAQHWRHRYGISTALSAVKDSQQQWSKEARLRGDAMEARALGLASSGGLRGALQVAEAARSSPKLHPQQRPAIDRTTVATSIKYTTNFGVGGELDLVLVDDDGEVLLIAEVKANPADCVYARSQRLRFEKALRDVKERKMVEPRKPPRPSNGASEPELVLAEVRFSAGTGSELTVRSFDTFLAQPVLRWVYVTPRSPYAGFPCLYSPLVHVALRELSEAVATHWNELVSSAALVPCDVGSDEWEALRGQIAPLLPALAANGALDFSKTTRALRYHWEMAVAGSVPGQPKPARGKGSNPRGPKRTTGLETLNSPAVLVEELRQHGALACLLLCE